jgi:uncharacterized protein YceH (UPF0502 family)
MTDLRPLDPLERRVLGALIEKELSTPDQYPLTVNALVAACNQSSNRDPVMTVGGEEAQRALDGMMGLLLVWRERGARTLRWKHLVDDKLRLDRAAKAVLAELLLRGPQTPGELRGRSGRMHEMRGLGEVEAVLTELAARRLVEELPRQPGQKERRWRELLAAGIAAPRPSERGASEAGPAPPPTRTLADRLRDAERAAEERRTRAAPPPPGPAGSAAPTASPPADAAGSGAPRDEPPGGELRHRLDDLERQVAELTRRLAELERLAKAPPER